jgi:sortase A
MNTPSGSGSRRAGAALALLRIPALQLEVPVLEGTDAVTLNSGVGRIAGTAFPGEPGNIGIAGHRDSFFQGLKGVNKGDTIQLTFKQHTDTYVVDMIEITSPEDISVLEPGPQPELTLVTCYPFSFIGPAPRRFVVRASLKQM